jgi:2',3'-cyclic-nucleotide 2'-phosphodiesterase (5'-nucleotidase family)
MRRPALLLALITMTLAGIAVASSAGTAVGGTPADHHKTEPLIDKAVFFASDGLRQDIVEQNAKKWKLKEFEHFLKDGVRGADYGLQTQAPPNTGAGWYSLATGAWPGVHGSTNNTFHINGAVGAAGQANNFTSRTAAFDANVLKAESIAQAAERGGLKVAQIEWAGGRNASINGPTIDFQAFFSGRGVATNFIGTANDPLFDNAANIAAFGVQFDHPAGYAGQPAFPGAAPKPATGWTNVPASALPPMEMRLRVLDFGIDKYGLNAYIYASGTHWKNSRSTGYDRVLFSRTKDGADKVADLAEGELADVKVKIADGPSAGLTAGMLVKVEVLSKDLSKVRLFHTSVSRALATWPGWSEPGFTGDFAEYLAQKFPTSTAADFAVLEAGIVSEDTYVEQGLYWGVGHEPMLEYVMKKYKPDFALVGVPTTDEFSHQFMGLISPKLPNGQANPAYDDVNLDGHKDGRVDERTDYLKSAYQEADHVLDMSRHLIDGGDVTTFVASDHGFAPQFLAIDASLPLVQLGLLSRPQTSNCRPATGETIGKAKACWAGGALQIYLNVAGRDPAGNGFQQVAATAVDSTVAQIRAKYQGLVDPNDWTHDGQPEGWKMIDRTYSKAEARYIPNGGGGTSDMAHPTRTGDLVVFAYPPYQWDAETPGTLVAPSQFFGQHGYVPDVQNLQANINMRATFLAAGKEIDKKENVRARTIDLAPTLAFMLGIPEPQHSQGKVLLGLLKHEGDYRTVPLLGLNDFHGQLDQTTLAFDGGINATVGGAPFLATMFDEERANLPVAVLLAGGDNVGASPPNSALLQDIPAIDVENAWDLKATSFGNHEFDFGVPRILLHEARANFPFLATNIVQTSTGLAPSWVQPSEVVLVNGTKVGVIGAELQSTPELVSAGNTAGLTFLPEAPRIKAESERLRQMGIKVQVVVIHQGTADGLNRVGNAAAVPWTGPILAIADELQDTTIDAMIVGHTHRISNLMRGDILVTEGINAGTSYSVLQLITNKKTSDVVWAGGATRVAKNLGVAPRADVKSIVDAANAATAVLRNQVIGTQATGDDILRDLARRHESEMGNMVADAMREKYPGVDGAWTNSGGLRADIVYQPPSAGELPGQITWGEVFAVLPFGNRTVILPLTGAQIKTAFLNGFSAFCDPSINTGRFPQISGLKVQFHCAGLSPVLDGVWKAPNGPGAPLTPLADADTFRFVTNDFMYTGGDGYTVFGQGTNVQQPGDDLMQVALDYITAHSPVAPHVEGRIIGP